MSNAKRDANNVPVMMGVSSVDGVTPLPFKVNASTGALLLHVADATTAGSVTASSVAKRDANNVPTKLG